MENLKAVLYWRDAAANPTLSRCVSDYSHVRLHHFCRPPSFDSYKQGGIRLFSNGELSERFHRIFPEVSEEVRQTAINAVINDRLPPRIDAALDDHYMIKNANHYARYGSEMIWKMTNHLPSGSNYLQRLNDIGKPAMIVFDAPVKELEASDVTELNTKLELLSQCAYKNFDGPNYQIDFTASFFKTVPTEWIVEYRWLDSAIFVADPQK